MPTLATRGSVTGSHLRPLVALAGGLSLVLLVTGCPQPTSVPDAPVVSVLPASGTGSLLSYSDGVVRLTGGGQPPAVGDFLVSIQESGFLRRVDSVATEAGGDLTIQTSQATLAEAVEDGDFAFTDGPPAAKTMVRAKAFEIFTMQKDLSRELYNRNGVTVTTSGD